MSELKDFLNGGGSLAPQVNANTESIRDILQKNFIVNGDVSVNQIGNNQRTGVTSGTLCFDFWKTNFSSPTIINVDRASGDYPVGFYSSFKTTYPTAFTSLDAGSHSNMAQIIETTYVKNLIGKEFTISFWVKSSVAGTFAVSIRDCLQGSGTSTISYVATYQINSANTWEKKVITVSGGLPTTTNWNTSHITVEFTQMAGTNYTTTYTNQWVSGTFLANVDIPNVASSANNSFNITGVKLELGSQATAFEFDYEEELRRCKRRYQKHRIFSVLKPSTSTSYLGYTGLLPVEMVKTPTVTYSYGGQPNRVNIQDVGITAISAGGFILTSSTCVNLDAIVNVVGNNWFDVDVVLDAQL